MDDKALERESWGSYVNKWVNRDRISETGVKKEVNLEEMGSRRGGREGSGDWWERLQSKKTYSVFAPKEF